MSYDLDQLAQKYGLKTASIRFNTSTDLAGTSIIPLATNANPIIQQILFQASAYFSAQIERTTAAATAYWIGMGMGPTAQPVVEPTYIVCDAGTAVALSAQAAIGAGIIRIWYTLKPGATGGGLGAL